MAGKSGNLMNYWISADWGTSSLRLYLMDKQKGTILDTFENSDGIKLIFSAYIVEHLHDQLSYFRIHLQRLLNDFLSNHGIEDRTIPVVLSGMVSSSIGMLELPYTVLPLALDGSTLQTRFLEGSTEFNPLYLISGCHKEGDVMRGEEVQTIGWKSITEYSGDIILILPGTHSKHIEIRNDQISNFSTYMTGELFDIIRNHSILKSSTAEETDAFHNAHFIEGLDASKGIISNGLFKIRALDLQHKFSNGGGASYLSGLLIGHELSGLCGYSVCVLAGERLFKRYSIACRYLRIHLLETTDDHEIAHFTIRGQEKVLQNLLM